MTSIKYIGPGRSMHGCLDRSYDSYRFIDSEGTDIDITVYPEPDYTILREYIEYDFYLENSDNDPSESEKDFEYERLIREYETEYEVIYSGALEFNGTEEEFKERYPELYAVFSSI